MHRNGKTSAWRTLVRRGVAEVDEEIIGCKKKQNPVTFKLVYRVKRSPLAVGQLGTL